MNIYACGGTRAKTVCKAFAKGCGGKVFEEGEPKFREGTSVVWGQLRGAKEILDQSKEFYRLDHAYIGRMEYYRATKNDFQPKDIVDRPPDRFNRLVKEKKLVVKDWGKGSHILVCGSMPDTYNFFGVGAWESWAVAQVKQFTDRPVILRKRKEGTPIEEQLKGCHAVVTYASNSAVDALLFGVPVFVLGPSIARPLSGDLIKIETPNYPDREKFFNHLAYSQFTHEEFERGFAWKVLNTTGGTSGLG